MSHVVVSGHVVLETPITSSLTKYRACMSAFDVQAGESCEMNDVSV